MCCCWQQKETRLQTSREDTRRKWWTNAPPPPPPPPQSIRGWFDLHIRLWAPKELKPPVKFCFQLRRLWGKVADGLLWHEPSLSSKWESQQVNVVSPPTLLFGDYSTHYLCVTLQTGRETKPPCWKDNHFPLSSASGRDVFFEKVGMFLQKSKLGTVSVLKLYFCPLISAVMKLLCSSVQS